MNEQLPPVDLELRAQLERRAAGRVPAGLLGDVLAELDSVPVSRPIVSMRPRPQPRTAGALVGVAAVVALLAALVAVPALQDHSGVPAGYPADRALTTAELAAVMSGPALATNTALVADVTIQNRSDVCPMDRYPTVGVVEGMPSQVCVMGSGLSAYMNVGSDTGVFAFRYLAPGVLGLIGQITPDSSRLAFEVSEDWPLQGKTFVVEGWLGAESRPYPCPSDAAGPGDALSPNGAECGVESWLAASATPDAIATPADRAFANESIDPLELYGNARLVKAGGMRQIDSVDWGSPQRGAYVVRSATGACPGAPDYSSVGCGYWLVLAKLAILSLPSATPTPTASATPTSAPPSGYPIDRPLTTTELGRLLDAGSLKTYDTVVVDAEVTAEASGACKSPGVPDLEFAGFVVGVDPQVCIFAVPGVTIAPGHLLLRELAGRTLGYMVTLPDTSPFAYSAPEAWPQGDFLVHGWLGTDPRDCGKPAAQPTMMGYGLFPDGRVMCYAAMTATAFDPTKVVYTGPSPAGPPRLTVGVWDLPADGKAVDPGPLLSMPGISPVGGSVEGTYVVEAGHHCSEYGDCLEYSVLARLADVTPEPTPSPSPSAQPPATPVTTALSGYPTDRALNTAELGRVLMTDGVKDKVVVAQVSVGKGNCPPLGGYLPIGNVAGLDSVCVVGIGDGKPEHSPASSSGVFAFRVLDSRTLGFMADVTPVDPTVLSHSADASWPTGKTILVTAWLTTGAGPYFCPVMGQVVPEALDPGGTSCPPHWLSPGQAPELSNEAPSSSRAIAVSNYPAVGGDLAGGRLATYLVRDESKCNWPLPSADPASLAGWDRLCGWQIMAEVDSISLPALPPPSPTPASSPTATSRPALWGSGNRPFTVEELMQLWNAGELGGRVVITKGPVHTCPGAIFEGSPCSALVAGEGYWIIQFDAASKPILVGGLSTPGSRFVSTLDQLSGSTTLATGSLVVAEGYLIQRTAPTCTSASLGAKCYPRMVDSYPETQNGYSLILQMDAYQSTTGRAADPAQAGPPVHGLFLIRIGNPGLDAEVLAQLSSR